MAITETWLKANYKKLRSKKLIQTDRDGLNARLSPKGKITFMMRYYYDTARKEYDIGTYPLMTLKEAREENQRLRKKLDPENSLKPISTVRGQGYRLALSTR